MRSHLSLLSTLALLTFTAIGCAGGIDSIDDADQAVGQAALRIDSSSDGTSQQTAGVDKIGLGATEVVDDTGSSTDDGTDDGPPAAASATKGGEIMEEPAAATPQINGVALGMDDGALTISIDASDPEGLALSTSYSGFVVGAVDGLTITVSALDIALAAASDATPEIDVVIEDATGEQATTAISLDVAALVEGSLGDSGVGASTSSAKGALIP
jgi:hypothetical protein